MFSFALGLLMLITATFFMPEAKNSFAVHAPNEAMVRTPQIIALKDAPGSSYMLRPFEDSTDSDAIGFHIVTSQDYPHYVSYTEAKRFCGALRGGWRLPEEGELYGLREHIEQGGVLRGEAAAIYMSRAPYWSATTEGERVKTVTLSRVVPAQAVDRLESHGVVCIAGDF